MAKKRKSERDSIEKELSDLNELAGSKMEAYYCDSAYVLYGKLRERAKIENSLLYYVFGTFFQMNLAQRLLQYETVRERAVELISIFENEEHARKIEPELELEQYEGLKYSMCACAYELLAEATGDLDGYNSEGMQECLSGGIEVCHRIGKLSCVGCFREYACVVHKAADDYELARFHCNQVLKHQEDFADRGDRRWLAAMNLAVLDLFEGQHDVARQRLDKAWELASEPTVNSIIGAKISIAIEQHTLDTLDGKPTDARTAEAFEALPPRGECPDYDFEMDLLKGLMHTVRGEWEEGEKAILPWNRKLKQSNSITKWLESGIRLVALRRLRGDIEGAKKIAVPLEEIATRSNDWHSVRRLNQILDAAIDITPLGTVVKNSKVLLDGNSNITAIAEDQSTRSGYHELSADTPLYQWLNDFGNRLQNSKEQAPEEVDVDAFRSELTESQNRDWSHPEDIGRAIFFMSFLVTPGADYRAIWTWANRLVANYQDTGYLISLLARLGMSINAAERFEQFSNIDFSNLDEELPPSLIESEKLDQLTRKSLQLDSSGVNNNFRAGEIFEYIDNLGEAERCYARAFKLDRTREDAALALARIYSNSDRVSDAHHVLDLCIREGGNSSELYFEAAMRAHALSMHELQVSYLRTYVEKHPIAPWVHYYMAIGLLELKKPDEALAAIQIEIDEFEEQGLHIEAIRAEAYAQLGKMREATDAITSALTYKLSEIDNLTTGGIASAMERLWRACKQASPDSKLLKRVEKRLLESGLTPEDFFSERRAHQKPRDLSLFIVTMLQPLEDDWENSPGCLPDQVDWQSYVVQWGVLAETADEAEEYAIHAQKECYAIDAEVIDIQQENDPLHDRPGVAFQGYRSYEDDMLDEEDDDDDESGDEEDDLRFDR